jgi:hypothetical protein
MKKMVFNKLLIDGNILVIGCGGGFDAGSALPLWSYLNRNATEKCKVFLGGVQEPNIRSFEGCEYIDGKESSAICWLTPKTRLSIDAPDHPILTVRHCPELCISRSLGISVVYLSASQEIEATLGELLTFCEMNKIKTIITVDTGIDSHVSQDSQGNLGDPEVDCWTRKLLSKVSSHQIKCFLANVCVGVETWISEDVKESFKRALNSSFYEGVWSPSKKDVSSFFKVWQDSENRLGFAPSNTGYVLHQALLGVQKDVELPHSEGIFVSVNESTANYYFFKL